MAVAVAAAWSSTSWERSEASGGRAGGTTVLWRAANSCAAAAGVCSVEAFCFRRSVAAEIGAEVFFFGT